MPPEPQPLRFWSLPPVAFYTALLAAPVRMAFIGLVLLPIFGFGVIVILAIPFGAPSYFLVGGPLFWREVLRGTHEPGDFIIAAFWANLIAAPLTILVLAAFPALITALSQSPYALAVSDPIEAALFIHGFGLVLAPIFGLQFGHVFLKLVDPELLPPDPSPTRDFCSPHDIKETLHA